MDLQGFLNQNADKQENRKAVISKRFQHEGQPIAWEIRALAAGEEEKIRKDCTVKVPVPGKRGQFTQEMDLVKYMSMLATKCVVFPNLNDAELQNSYHVLGAEALLKTMLLPGEYANLLNEIQEVNRFDISMDDLVDEAKN